MNICIAQPVPSQYSETFLRAHAEKLTGHVTVVSGKRARIATTRKESFLEHLLRGPLAAERLILGRSKTWEYTQSYLRRFRKLKPDVVIAEYGVTGVHVMDACRIGKYPLIVYFRGFDASHLPTLKMHEETYPILFRQAAAIVAVSHSIKSKLIALGADPEKIHYNPSGSDTTLFSTADPANADPVLISVGRFTNKKGPHLTISAFATVAKDLPEARLRMIGDGPLFPKCRRLISQLGLEDRIDLLGVKPHSVVAEELRNARAFVQHSITATDGDSEGTPGAITEAGATGIPVISTRHAGIPDVVLEGKTGFLVDEGDVAGMSRFMRLLLENRELAAKMGIAARARVQSHFSQQASLAKLQTIIEQCVAKHSNLRGKASVQSRRQQPKAA